MSHSRSTDEWFELRGTLGVEGTEGEREVVSPIDGETLAWLPEDSEPLDPVTPASWAGCGFAERHRALRRFADALSGHKAELARVLCIESGLPITQCQRSISASLAHLDSVAATLRLPPDMQGVAQWIPRGPVTVSLGPRHGIADDLAALSSALYCGCSVRWAAPVGRQLLARVIIQLWRMTDGATEMPLVPASPTPAQHSRRPNRVWVTASAPVEHAVDAIVDGVHWHNGLGVDSVHHVLIDHSLHWELEQRLTAALQRTVVTDPRDHDCQRAEPGAIPAVRSIDEHEATPDPEDTCPDLVLQPVSDLPAITIPLHSISLFGCDQRDIDLITGSAGHGSHRVCINTLPSLTPALSPLAWSDWLRPQQLTVKVDTP